MAHMGTDGIYRSLPPLGWRFMVGGAVYVTDAFILITIRPFALPYLNAHQAAFPAARFFSGVSVCLANSFAPALSTA